MDASLDTACDKFLLSPTSTWVDEGNISQYGLFLAKYASLLTQNSVDIEELESTYGKGHRCLVVTMIQVGILDYLFDLNNKP